MKSASNAQEAIHLFPEVAYWYREFLMHNTTTPPQRKPLTHEQRLDLIYKFETHKHEWNADSILIDMIEAAHGIKENT
jgi:hypothetical protein